MFDISSLKSDTDFDGFMVRSDGEIMTISLLTKGTALLECELCSTLSARVYLVAGLTNDAANVHQCQSCLHEAVQCADMSGDQYFAPLSH